MKYLILSSNRVEPFAGAMRCVLIGAVLVSAVCVSTPVCFADSNVAVPQTGLFNPNAIVLNRATGKVYVVDSADDSILVSSDATDKHLEVKVGAGPVSIAVDTVNGRAYVANSGDGTVSVLDGKSDKVIATLQVGAHPYSIAADSKRGKVYVSHTFSSQFTVIDASTQEITQLKAGGVDLIAVDSAAGVIYKLGYEGGSVAAMDAATLSTHEASAGMHAWGMVVNERAGTVYVARTGEAEVDVFDRKPQLKQRIKVGSIPNAMALNARTQMMFVANYESNSVSFVDLNTGLSTRQVATGVGPEAVAVDEERNLIFVANTHADTVTIINGATGRVRATLAAGKSPYALVYNPALKKLHVANLGTTPETTLTIE